MRLDLANLKDVPLVVRRDEQGPLVRVALLSIHEAAVQIVCGGADVLHQLRVLFPVAARPPWRSFSRLVGSSDRNAVSR